MRWVVLLLAAATLGTGLRAALLWYRSSRIMVSPVGPLDYTDQGASNFAWVLGLIEAGNQTAALNAKAAAWTAASVALGVAATVLGLLLPI